MKLEPKMFFPINESGIIAPPTFKINEPNADRVMRQRDYEKIPTMFKAKNHLLTEKYKSCIVGEHYQLIFRNSGEIILSCNFKQDKNVECVQDIIDYGVVL